jgi:hypothetical protein
MDQDVGVLHHAFHAVRIRNEVGKQVTVWGLVR